jgi:hypothetical protein
MNFKKTQMGVHKRAPFFILGRGYVILGLEGVGANCLKMAPGGVN